MGVVDGCFSGNPMVSHVKGCLYSWVYFWFSMFRWFFRWLEFFHCYVENPISNMGPLPARMGMSKHNWWCHTRALTRSPAWIDCQLILRTIFGGQNGWIDAGKAESCWVLKTFFCFCFRAAHYHESVQVGFWPDFLQLLLVRLSFGVLV